MSATEFIAWAVRVTRTTKEGLTKEGWLTSAARRRVQSELRFASLFASSDEAARAALKLGYDVVGVNMVAVVEPALEEA